MAKKKTKKKVERRPWAKEKPKKKSKEKPKNKKPKKEKPKGTKISRDGINDWSNPAWYTIVEAAATELSPEDEAALSREGDLLVVFTVNGVALDFERAMESWAKSYYEAIPKAAAELVNEKLSDSFEGLNDLLNGARDDLKKKLLAKLGIEIRDDD